MITDPIQMNTGHCTCVHCTSVHNCLVECTYRGYAISNSFIKCSNSETSFNLAKPKVIITADERVHGRETHALKDNVDEALKKSGHEVDQIFVASRTGKQVPMTPGRDVSLEKVITLICIPHKPNRCALTSLL